LSYVSVYYLTYGSLLNNQQLICLFVFFLHIQVKNIHVDRKQGIYNLQGRTLQLNC